MLKNADNTLTNLRLMAGIKKHEYIQTSSEGDILSYLGSNFIHCVSSLIFRENWDSTMHCLNKLYVKEIPALLTDLFEQHEEKDDMGYDELEKIKKKLKESKKGLINLKVVYQATKELKYIETIEEDFLDCQITRIDEFIKGNSQSQFSEIRKHILLNNEDNEQDQFELDLDEKK